MKWISAVPAAVLLVLVSVGCNNVKNANSDRPLPPLETAKPEVAALPAKPLWPEPGLRLLDGKQDWSPSYTYETFEIDGKQSQAIATPEGYYFVRQEEQAVYLVGSRSERGGFERADSPRLLYRLPLEPGDQWQYVPDGTTYVVKGVEQVKTPAGQQLAARIEVTAKDQDRPLSQWWVPGYGLVQFERSKAPLWTAAKEVREKPKPAPGVGHPTPSITALLEDNGRQWFVTDVSNGRELFRIDDGYWRSWYRWQPVGQFDLLTHTHFPGSWGVYGYSALRFNTQKDEFERVGFVDAKGNEVSTAGTGRWATEGLFELKDFLHYPARLYVFRWDGTAMRSDPKAEKLEWAASPADLVRRLFNPPPLGKEDYAAAFLGPEEGRKFFDLLPGEVRAGAGYYAQPDPASSGAFRILRGFRETDPLMATVKVTEQGGRFYIASYEWFGPEGLITGPLGEADKEILGVRLETMKLPDVEAVLGKPVEAIQKAGTSAYTRVYRGGTVTVDYVGDGWNTVWAITVTGSGKTPRGVSIGDTQATVLQRYGTPHVQSDQFLEYYDEGKAGYYYLRFRFTDGKVQEIELHRSK